MMSTLILPAFLLACCFVLCAALIMLLLPMLRRHKVIDAPNERSSHSEPVVRGGGWAIGFTLIIAGMFIALWVGPCDNFIWLGLGFILLMITSACDDIKALSVKFRLFVQTVAVLCGLDALSLDPLQNQIFVPLWGEAVPGWIEYAILVVGWVWFINLFNFMDGLDGLASIGAITICLATILLICAAGLLLPHIVLLAAAIIGVIAAFLCWNWHPAKLFMGDTGSVPLGYMLGFLLIALAQAGLLFAALIPPLYFIADTTVTLIRRLARGEKFWHAHREFFFHQAQRQLKRHDQVVYAVIICHAALIGCSLLALKIGGWALISAAGAVAVLCGYFHKQGKLAAA